MSEKDQIILPPELNLPDSIVSMLCREEEIKRYFLPSEIHQALDRLVQECEESEDISARFAAHGSGEAESFELTLNDAEGQVVIFLDGVHTNEVIGGRAVVELLNAATKNPQIMKDLGVKQFVYHNMNPSEMEMNGEWFMEGEMGIAEYLKGAHRSALNFDWGYVLEEGGRARFLATQHAVHLYDIYEPDVAIPLHNSGAGNAYVYTNSIVSMQVARQLSAFLMAQYVAEPPEPGIHTKERAPGVYYLLPSNRMFSYASSLTYTESRDIQAISLELPYFKSKKEMDSEVGEDEAAHVRSLAYEVEALLEKCKGWEFSDPIPDDTKKILMAIETYGASTEKREAAANQNGAAGAVKLRLALLFYPALLLGHAMRAASRLHEAGYGEEFGEYAGQCDRLIDKIAVELKPYFEATTRRHQMSMYLGALSILLYRGNNAATR